MDEERKEDVRGRVEVELGAEGLVMVYFEMRVGIGWEEEGGQ